MFRQKRQSGLADHTACEPVGRMQIGVCNRQLASPPKNGPERLKAATQRGTLHPKAAREAAAERLACP